ncbi:hypothetical protein H5410_031591 [Solanum commersonii]|uniref:Uncharacterized protein n=1 Tax=Solanum commersonii TaxID=4109 RepID=A0A9J5YJL6_SOLCO|nr:hypothetical protein H5410_031591 [Solanum commersonii]
MKGAVDASPIILQSRNIPPNGPERTDAEGKTQMAVNLKKGESSSHSAVFKLEEEVGFISKDLDLGLLDSSFLSCNKT